MTKVAFFPRFLINLWICSYSLSSATYRVHLQGIYTSFLAIFVCLATSEFNYGQLSATFALAINCLSSGKQTLSCAVSICICVCISNVSTVEHLSVSSMQILCTINELWMCWNPQCVLHSSVACKYLPRQATALCGNLSWLEMGCSGGAGLLLGV